MTGSVITDPFLLNLGTDIGIVILLLLIALAVFLFFRKSFKASGLLCWFIGILMMYNDINFLICLIPFFIGLSLIVSGGRR